MVELNVPNFYDTSKSLALIYQEYGATKVPLYTYLTFASIL